MIVRESINFERGQDPRSAMNIGYKATSEMHKALKISLEDSSYTENDWIDRWLKENILLANSLEYSGPSDLKNLVGFDDDYFSEAYDIDIDALNDEFKSTKKPMFMASEGGGSQIIKVGKLIDGTKIVKYIIGMTSGYMTRKEWIK